MVKNLKGGKGAKNLARKNTIVSTGTYSKIRVSQDPLEIYATVVKLLGNGMCYIDSKNHKNLICHIRNKFSGRGKRDNTLTVGSVILVGLREWETTIKNCDLICLYSSIDLNTLTYQPGFDLIITAEQHDSSFNAGIEDDDENDEIENKKSSNDVVAEPVEDINFDDI